jgi:hypothetical protein
MVERRLVHLAEGDFLFPIHGLLADYLCNWIFECDPLRIILPKPCVGRLLVGENLQMLRVADLLARIDIDPDCHENASLARFIAGEVGDLDQCGERPAR